MFLKVKNSKDTLDGVVAAPPSKSYSHRAVILASLSEGESKLSNVLMSEDVLSSINVSKALGANFEIDGNEVLVKGTGGNLHNSSKDTIDLGNSGTTLRLLTSISALSDNEVVLSGDSSLQTRPMGPLLDSLKGLGVTAESVLDNGKAPIHVYPGYLGGHTSISGSVSSQFVSSILISGALSKKGVKLDVLKDFVSKPYVDMTIDIMKTFGVDIEKYSYGREDLIDETYLVSPSVYKSCEYTVEGDFSSASYLLAACAIVGGEIKVKNLFKNSKQGDKLILDILEDMGCSVSWGEDYVILKSSGNLEFINVDLEDAPDLLLTVAVLAACANGRSVISGVEHGRLKETDRISTCCSELKKLNVKVNEFKDGMAIEGGFTGGIVNSHKDHRLAMAFSLLGLKTDVLVEDGEVFNISFPDFIEAMAEVGVNLELME